MLFKKFPFELTISHPGHKTLHRQTLVIAFLRFFSFLSDLRAQRNESKKRKYPHWLVQSTKKQNYVCETLAKDLLDASHYQASKRQRFLTSNKDNKIE